jgi:hypothetical protein
MATQAECERALNRFAEDLSRRRNVVGLGIVRSEESLRPASHRNLVVAVYVRRKLPRDELAEEDVVPAVLRLPGHGRIIEVPTRVIELGDISLKQSNG